MREQFLTGKKDKNFYIEFFINPTSTEFNECLKISKRFKCLIDVEKDNFYMWTNNNYLHINAINDLKLKKDNLLTLEWNYPKVISMTNTCEMRVRETKDIINNNKNIKKFLKHPYVLVGENDKIIIKESNTMLKKLNKAYMFEHIHKIYKVENDAQINEDTFLEKNDFILVEAEDTKDIEVENPGKLQIPKDKNFWDMPLSHYIDLAKRIGKSQVMTGLLNLERWNKNDDPDISKKARVIIDKLKANKEYQDIESK